MASNTANNMASSGNRANRLNNFDRVPKTNSPLSLGNGVAANSTAWDGNGSIWANGNSSTPFTDGAADSELRNGSALNSNGDAYYFRGKTGSASLLSNTESTGWNGRSNVPWGTTTNSNSSPSSRLQGRPLYSTPFRDGENTTSTTDLPPNGRNISSFFPADQYALLDVANSSPQGISRHPTGASQHRNMNSAPLLDFHSESRAEAQQREFSAALLRASNSASSTQSSLRYINPGTEVSSLTPGKLQQTSISTKPRKNLDLPETQSRSSRPFIPADLRSGTFSHATHRHPSSTHRSFPGMQDRALQFDGQEDEFSTKFDNMDLQAETMSQDYTSGFQSQDQTQRMSSNLDRPLESGFSRTRYQSGSERIGLTGQFSASPNGAAEPAYRYPTDYQRSMAFGDRETLPAVASDYRRSLNSPFYSTNGGTPPTGPESVRSASGSGFSNHAPNGQMIQLDRESRASRPVYPEEQYMLPTPSQARMQYNQPFDIEGGYAGSLRLNPLALPYPVPAYHGLTSSYSSRYPSREYDSSQIVRSALLEDFRANHKTSKRYELKDIYGHVVEFSGDQHGSRFIQQKLETANSDEKDQIFAEIQPNSLQLMTDVFGNYVIQKLFEHGNQAQKKILANQMKNRVMDLSTQMYGCRVVQKALEHILTDQQASIVKELEPQVIKCVKDQNGNHVIQKAIERVPPEHIQFIINAFTGQVNHLAIHSYGCRVIQRMLEHCQEPARRSILRELHTGLHSLIIDQYGNYVIQHVIEKGHERDRTKVVATVISQLLTFSKHKFASNVVEKSIQCAEAGQRAKILAIITTPNEKGENPLLGLMRDQYGNYVIQKSLGGSGFRDEERKLLVEYCKPEFTKLKRFSSGKQVVALEKLIYDGDSEPDLSSSQSSTIPSANASTVEGPTTLTLPSAQILKTSFEGTAIASTP